MLVALPDRHSVPSDAARLRLSSWVSQNGSDRLMNDPEVSGRRAQIHSAGPCADRRFLPRRVQPGRQAAGSNAAALIRLGAPPSHPR